MLRVCVTEPNVCGRVLINMCPVIVCVLNGLLGLLETTDIDSRCLRVISQIVIQILQLVVQVLRTMHFLLEVLSALSLSLSSSLCLCFAVLLFFQLLESLYFQCGVTLFFDFAFGGGFTLHFCSVKQVLGEEVHWVLRIGLVKNLHAFGNDKADLVRHKVVSVRGVADGRSRRKNAPDHDHDGRPHRRTQVADGGQQSGHEQELQLV